MNPVEGALPKKSLTHEERLAWLRLARTEQVGAITFHRLIERYQSAQAALQALPELSRRGGARRPLRVCDLDSAERELEHAARHGCRFIAACEPEYPIALRSADGCPPLLAVRGDVLVLQKPSVAIVGSRNASFNGLKIAGILATGVGNRGFSITSGLARGIDAEAHRAAVKTGTIAVIAGGLDRPYPKQNVPLLDEICETGAAVSEMPFGWEPRARDFPRRNRIIAGLGLGLVVVEAAFRSGSLISARMAGELGRLVFAVPGSPLDPRAKGTNALIKDGAILTTDAADVVGALTPLLGDTASDPRFVESGDRVEATTVASARIDDTGRRRIVDALGPAPVEIDEIVRLLNLPASEVYLVLLELDLAGRLERHADGSVSLAM